MTDHGRYDAEDRLEKEEQHRQAWREKVRKHGLDPDQVWEDQRTMSDLESAERTVEWLRDKASRIPEIHKKHFYP